MVVFFVSLSSLPFTDEHRFATHQATLRSQSAAYVRFYSRTSTARAQTVWQSESGNGNGIWLNLIFAFVATYFFLFQVELWFERSFSPITNSILDQSVTIPIFLYFLHFSWRWNRISSTISAWIRSIMSKWSWRWKMNSWWKYRTKTPKSCCDRSTLSNTFRTRRKHTKNCNIDTYHCLHQYITHTDIVLFSVFHLIVFANRITCRSDNSFDRFFHWSKLRTDRSHKSLDFFFVQK